MYLLKAAILCFLASGLFAQNGSLGGRVSDSSGALISGADVTLNGPAGFIRSAKASGEGSYSFTGLPPGNYSVTATAPGLSLSEPARVAVNSVPVSLDLRLIPVVATERVNVHDTAGAAVSLDASSNASATVLQGSDLQALSDDPEDLQADLEALAGPAAGPSGNAIFIDGFSGGQLPPKESIREVRINQNPFSPEFDRLGLGRIEIFTKPGTDKYHGTVTYNLGTDWWNSRNPYAAMKAPFLLQETENSFSGPITRHSSFTFDLERQAVDNGSVTNAVIVDPSTFAIAPFSSVLRTPQRHWRYGPHVDYQLNDNNYLSLRYTLTRADIRDAGIGSFDLISRGYHVLNTFNTVQAIETRVRGATVNETRFQYFRQGQSITANGQGPEIQVLGDFNGGAASSIHSHDVQSMYEFQNNTTIVRGNHLIRFGVRLRGQNEDSLSPQNFAGTFIFTSIDQYRQTLMFDSLGYSPAEVRALGGGASQFTLNAGTPRISAAQFDAAEFIGDDWRVRPNLTLNLGFRLEGQTNIKDHADYAPRIGLAWAPGATAKKTGKTVIRAGFGIFYDRFSLSNILAARRFNGIAEQQYVLEAPGFFPAVPAPQALGVTPSTQSIQENDAHLRAPYLTQSALTLERQLPRGTTFAMTYANAHALHVLRSDNINTPLPGTYSGPGTGVYPYPAQGPVLLTSSSGLYNQNQLIFNVNSRLNPAVSLFSSYVLNYAKSNTDGAGTFPGNPTSLAGEYGPAATDIRGRFLLGGTINTRWNLRFNPLVTYQTGAPFNITSGEDPYGSTLYFARPGIATDPARPGVVSTPYGLLDPNPLPGELPIGRNAGRGPAQIAVNLRVGKTWGFGPDRSSSGATSSRDSGGGNGGGLAPQGPPRGIFSSQPTSRRYNVSLGMSVRNLLNHTNAGPIIGNITSPLFGRSNQIAGSPNGEGFSENASNRRLELQLRFTF